MPGSGFINTQANITAPTGYEVDAYLTTITVKNLRTYLPFYDFCYNVDLGKKKGTPTTRSFLFNDLTSPETPVPLSEGVTNQPSPLTSEQFTVTSEQYGVWVPFDDWSLAMSQFDLLNVIGGDKVNRWIGEVVNKLVRNEMANTGSTYLAGNVTNVTDIDTAVTTADLLNIISEMETNNVLYLKEKVDPTTLISTAAVEPCYVALWPAIGKKDLLANVPRFMQPGQYNFQKVHDCEGGAFDNLRFLFHNLDVVTDGAGGTNAALHSTGGAVDVYDAYILGFGGIGVNGLVSESIQVMEEQTMTNSVKFMQTRVKGVQLHYHEPDYTDTDPLKQKAYVSGKFDMGVKVYQDPAVLRYRFGVLLSA